MDKEWAEKNGATGSGRHPQERRRTSPREHQRHRPVHAEVAAAGREDRPWCPNPNWWGKKRAQHHRGRVHAGQVRCDARRRPAFRRARHGLSGAAAGRQTGSIALEGRARCSQGPEARTIFLRHGFSSATSCSTRTSRVRTRSRTSGSARRSIYAIDVNAIKAKIMRESGDVAERADGGAAGQRLRQEAERPAEVRSGGIAKKLLAAAGYPKRLRGRHGLPQQPLRQRRADLPRRSSACWPRSGSRCKLTRAAEEQVLRQGPEVRHQLLPARLDADDLRFAQPAGQPDRLPRPRGPARASSIWAATAIRQDRHALTVKIQSETDQGKRQEMISRGASRWLKDDFGYIPLHQQPHCPGARRTASISRNGRTTSSICAS